MSAVSTTLPSASLAFQDGRSDKVYQAEVVPATNGAGFIVRFAYGRRGAALTAGVKTNAPVSLDAATKVFDKLVAEKRAKGYRDLDASGTIAAPVVAAAAQGIATPPRMQPTAATEAEGESFITDPQYAIQQKFDGRALTIVKQGDRIVGFNKLKQPTAIPAEAHAVLAAVSIDLTLDGEAFADHVVAYDVSAAQGRDITDAALDDRLSFIELFGTDGGLRFAYTAYTTEQKRALVAQLKADNHEGFVAKRIRGRYTDGKIVGGVSRKVKFWKSATVKVVGSHPSKRSVAVAVQGIDGAWLEVGNVTVPVNQPVPCAADRVEVRYLYVAGVGGALYQPTLLGIRTDETTDADCGIDQLEYKAD